MSRIGFSEDGVPQRVTLSGLPAIVGELLDLSAVPKLLERALNRRSGHVELAHKLIERRGFVLLKQPA